MSMTPYDFLSIVLVQNREKPKVESRAEDYLGLLESVRSSIAQNHAEELGNALNDASAVSTLKSLILKYTTDYMAGAEYDRDALVERVYQDMAGLGILTRYLQDPTVEEININAYNFLEIVRSTGTEFLCDEDAFPSREAALDIVRRMVRMGGKLLDAQTPVVDSHIGSSTRIAAKIPPIISEQSGVTASIRKQRKMRLTREMLVSTGTASADMLDFLTLCICNHTSIGIAGSTGAGKSALESFIANEYITQNDDYNNRIYTIEDTQELTLIQYDAANDRPARVQANFTSGKWTMFDLIKDALRHHPALIIPAEVRDGATYQALSAGQTGHTILTSFHANNARDSYERLLTLCHMAGVEQSDERLLEDCAKAWPIIVYAKQLKDNTRKIMEIFEATGVKDGKVVGHTLYRFHVEDNLRDGRGHITKVVGKHERAGCISPELYRHLKENGASTETLKRLFPDAKEEVV